MKLLIYIIIGAIGVILVLGVVYFILLFKLRNINNKIYKLKKEELIKENNVLIVYQPSIHSTINNLVELIKEEVINKGYGFVKHTLSKQAEDYSKYKYVIFVAPVYFGQVHNEFINKLSNQKIKNLLIVYNGLNKESDRENKELTKGSVNKYKHIKLHTEDINDVKEFIKREVL